MSDDMKSLAAVAFVASVAVLIVWITFAFVCGRNKSDLQRVFVNKAISNHVEVTHRYVPVSSPRPLRSMPLKR